MQGQNKMRHTEGEKDLGVIGLVRRHRLWCQTADSGGCPVVVVGETGPRVFPRSRIRARAQFGTGVALERAGQTRAVGAEQAQRLATGVDAVLVLRGRRAALAARTERDRVVAELDVHALVEHVERPFPQPLVAERLAEL